MEANVVQKITPMSIPQAYKDLGVESGYKPRPPEKLRMYIVGPSGQGKSTFVSGSPRTLILDFDDGVWGIPRKRASGVIIKDAEHLHRVTARLVEDTKNNARVFDRIVVDTIDQMLEVMNPELAAEKKNCTDITQWGGKGGGWSLLKTACWREIRMLEDVGYTWTFVGHLRESTITINDKEITVTRPVLFKTFANLLLSNCDVFASVYSAVEEVEITRSYKGRQIAAGTKKIPRIFMDISTLDGIKKAGEGKLRGVPNLETKIKLPEPIEGGFGWDAFCKVYTDAVEETKKRVAATQS